MLWKFALLLMAVAVLYVLAGFFLAPRLLKDAITAALTSHSGVETSIETLTVNPLTLELQAQGVVFAPAGAGPLLTLEQAFFRLRPAALATEGELRGRIAATGRTQGSGRFAISGWLAPLRPAMDAEVELSGTDLTAFATTVLPLEASQRLASAWLAGRGSVRYANEVATITGNLQVTDLAIVAVSDERPVFQARRVEGEGVVIEPSIGRVAIKALNVDAPVLWLEREIFPFDRDPVPPLLAPIIRPGSGGVEVNVLELRDGGLRFHDSTLPAPLRPGVKAIAGRIQLGGQDGPTGSLRGEPQGGGFIMMNWRGPGAVTTTLENVAAMQLSPYALALLGREITAGRLDANLDYRGDSNSYQVSSELSFLDLEIGAPQSTDGTFDSTLDLAIALLEDEHGRLRASIPVASGSTNANDPPLQALRTALLGLVGNLTVAPFTTLAAVVDQAGRDLDSVEFTPGSAALDSTATEHLRILAEGLLRRPRVAVGVSGRYDPVGDRDILAQQQMRLHIALATSAGPPGAVRPLDVDDPKVRDILDEFAGARLMAAEVAALRARFPDAGTDYYGAVFDALVTNEPVSQTALRALARYRARSIIDALVRAGVDADRLHTGAETETRPHSNGVIVVDLQIVVASADARSISEDKALVPRNAARPAYGG